MLEWMLSGHVNYVCISVGMGMCCPEEDVLKLEHAKNKTSKSTMTLVASHIYGEAWWACVMKGYLEELPSLLVLWPKVQSFTEVLANVGMEPTVASVAELMKVVKELPQLQSQLRPKSLKKMVENLKGTCAAFANKVLQPDYEAGKDLVVAVQGLLQGLSCCMTCEKTDSLAASLSCHLKE
eukprot:6466958-Amphidinium_carterae.1